MSFFPVVYLAVLLTNNGLGSASRNNVHKYPVQLLWIVMVVRTCISVEVARTWDSLPLDHRPMRFSIGREQNGSLPITVTGPLFRSPAAPSAPAGSLMGLWEYEVAELFFLGEHGKYLEVEFGPYGHYIVLLLNGERNAIKHSLPLEYEAVIDGKSWTGRASLPVTYLPAKVSELNAYAIHGEGKNRTYEALYPAPQDAHQEPNFHRLQYFRHVNINGLLTTDNSKLSAVWLEAMEKPSGC